MEWEKAQRSTKKVLEQSPGFGHKSVDRVMPRVDILKKSRYSDAVSFTIKDEDIEYTFPTLLDKSVGRTGALENIVDK